MIDPRQAHNIDARILLALLPGIGYPDLPEIRREFAQYLARPHRVAPTSWAQAWNLFTGAAQHRPGQISYTPTRCRTCGGKGWSVSSMSRNIGRTGNPLVCADCGGTRRGQRTTVTALYAALPEED